MSKSKVTSHILDTEIGQPAGGVKITLEYFSGNQWKRVGSGMTDDDGRVINWFDEKIEEGQYKISFEIAPYFKRQERKSFYPHVSIDFYIDNVDEHYHVPLLLNAHGYSTYRGS